MTKNFKLIHFVILLILTASSVLFVAGCTDLLGYDGGGITSTTTISATTTTTVIPLSDAEKAALAKADLSFANFTFTPPDSSSDVKSNFIMPVTGSHGSAISWNSDSSADVAVSAENAAVTRPAFADGNKTVTLTAIITVGLVSVTKTFIVMVTRMGQLTPADPVLTTATAIPANASNFSSTNGSIALTWPADANVSYWKVLVAETNSTSDPSADTYGNDLGIDSVLFTVTNLGYGNYYIWLKAFNAAGNSAWVAFTGMPVTVNVTDTSMPGTGTTLDPYLIYNLSHLKTARDNINTDGTSYSKVYKLMADIDMAADCQASLDGGGNGWTPIGINAINFRGTFDGNNHIISGMKQKTSGSWSNGGGFFFTNSVTVVKNLGLTDAAITVEHSFTGIMSGYGNGTYTNCHVSGTMSSVSSVSYVGGFFGQGGNALASFCWADVAITGSSVNYMGGFTGTAPGTFTAIKCAAFGSVSGGENVGGFSGVAGGIYNDCYSAVNVTGKRSIGGFAAYSWYVSSTMKNCYAIGSVTGNDVTWYDIGGFFGQNANSADSHGIYNCIAMSKALNDTLADNGSMNRFCTVPGTGTTLSFCYAYDAMTMTKKGTPVAATAKGLTAKDGADFTLANFKLESFYTTSGNWNTVDAQVWDFTTVWSMGTNGPVLRNLSGTIDQDAKIVAVQ